MKGFSIIKPRDAIEFRIPYARANPDLEWFRISARKQDRCNGHSRGGGSCVEYVSYGLFSPEESWSQ